MINTVTIIAGWWRNRLIWLAGLNKGQGDDKCVVLTQNLKTNFIERITCLGERFIICLEH